MAWFDSFEKRLSGNKSICGDERMNTAIQIISENFKKTPSYKKAFLTNLEEVTTNLDICVINTDKAEEKEVVLLPETRIEEGSYISFRDGDDKESSITRNYIVLNFEYNLISPKAKIQECKFSISLPHRETIPVIIEGESYGVKIISNTDFVNSVDSKVKMTIPDSVANRKYLDQNTRFCVNHTKHGIYKVGSIDMYSKGLIVLTCQKDKYLEEDNLDTGIMFQYDTDKNEEETPINTLTGSNEIIVDQEQTYTCSADATFSLDPYTIANGLASITSMTSKTCTIKAGLAHGEFITLTATIGAEKINKNINITRW